VSAGLARKSGHVAYGKFNAAQNFPRRLQGEERVFRRGKHICRCKYSA